VARDATTWSAGAYALNPLADYDGVGGYFLDVRPAAAARGANPTLPERALAWWERHLNGEQGAVDHFGEVARQLRASAQVRGSGLVWPDDAAARTRRRGRRASSPAVQGQAASVLARRHLRSGASGDEAGARAAIAPLIEPGSPVELAALMRGEAAPAPGEPALVLSGLIFALWGLRDVALALGDAGLRQAYEQGAGTLAGALAYYDTGWWTRHSLDADGHDLATVGEHRLHAAQAAVMARLTGRQEFARAARRWRRYDGPAARTRVRTVRARRRFGLGGPRVATGPPRVRAVVHHPYPPDPRVGREAAAFHDAGLDVEVLCQWQDGEPRRDVVDGVRVTRLAVERAGRATFRDVLREYCRFTAAAASALAGPVRAGRPELVHVHAPPDFLLAAALAPRLRGARLLLDIHDLSRDMFASRFTGRPGAGAAAAVLGSIERTACAIADEVVTVHKPYAEELIRRGVARRKVTVVMNAINERALEPARRRRARAGAHDGFTVAYHGTVAPWYGLDVLVEAVALARPEVPGIRALIVGAGDAMEPTRRRAGELGVADVVELVGPLPHEEALERIACADCGVIPNKPTQLNRFALSSKLFEYVALGIPVAVARLDTLAQHFDEDEVAFFTPGRAASLADALVAIARDPEAARARAERARARARGAYSWSRNRDELLARAFELIPEPPAAAWRPRWWMTECPDANAGARSAQAAASLGEPSRARA
jgi:glycosyltransferase involved in cell wall biosynthesis